MALVVTRRGPTLPPSLRKDGHTSTVPGTGDLLHAPGGLGIYGLDQETGAIVWTMSTVDTPDLRATPRGEPGGGCWYTPGIDTTTGMTYGRSRPAPSRHGRMAERIEPARAEPVHEQLMALDDMTGTTTWSTQVLPTTSSTTTSRSLRSSPRRTSTAEQQEIEVSAGKMGTVYAFNRSTGALLWQTDVGEQNGNDKLDGLPNGTTTVTPSASAASDADGLRGRWVYVPVVNLAMTGR